MFIETDAEVLPILSALNACVARQAFNYIDTEDGFKILSTPSLGRRMTNLFHESIRVDVLTCACCTERGCTGNDDDQTVCDVARETGDDGVVYGAALYGHAIAAFNAPRRRCRGALPVDDKLARGLAQVRYSVELELIAEL